jgi:predicted ABC-type exoprotein transport system permease subunit
LCFFVKWQWVKSHIRKSSQQSYLLEKIILFLGLLLFFPIFFSIHTLGSRIIFLCSHILGKGMFFFQKGDYLFFVYFVMFSKGIIRLFLKYNNQKIMEREEIERSKWKNEAFKIASKKVYFELETDLYLAKIFDFEFQHHDHQTSL